MIIIMINSTKREDASMAGQPDATATVTPIAAGVFELDEGAPGT